MRSLRLWVIAGLVASSTLLSGCRRADAFESFTLERQDRIIAEAPGCSADCRPMGLRKTCVIRELGCKLVCSEFPECRPDGLNAVRACALVKVGR